MNVTNTDIAQKNGTFSFPQNTAGSDEFVMYLTGRIGETFFQDGIELARLKNELSGSKAKKVKMYLSTEGGDMKAAFDIVSFMKSQNKSFEVINAGMAASAGTLLLAGGDKASSYTYAVGMLHKPQSFAFGDEADMQDAIDVLRIFEESVYPIYLDRIEKNGKLVNGSREETKQLLKDKYMKAKTMTWLTADDMLELGIIDNIIKEKVSNKTVQNHITNCLGTIKDIPSNVANNLNTIFNNIEKEEEMSLFNNIINAFKSKKIDLPENATETDIVKVINELPTVEETEDLTAILEGQKTEITNAFETKFTEVTNLVNGLKDKVTEVENKAKGLETENATLKSTLASLQDTNTSISNELATLKGSKPPMPPAQNTADTIVDKPTNVYNGGIRKGTAVVKTVSPSSN